MWWDRGGGWWGTKAGHIRCGDRAVWMKGLGLGFVGLGFVAGPCSWLKEQQKEERHYIKVQMWRPRVLRAHAAIKEEVEKGQEEGEWSEEGRSRIKDLTEPPGCQRGWLSEAHTRE